jgi:Calcineurin-like phosphoesterase
MKLRLLSLGMAILVWCGSAFAATVDFVQITDPHIFDGKGDVEGNKAALKWCINEINGRIGPSADYKFIVVTGDLGLEGLPCAANEKEPAPAVGEKAEELADIIKQSKVKQWLFLPGNNDLVGENPANIGTFHRFIKALKEQLPEKEIVDFCPVDNEPLSGIHDEGTCRFIGFNDASFKSDDSGANAEKTAEREGPFFKWQEGNVKEVLARLEPKDTYKYAYIFYHIPEIDDPYYVSLDQDHQDFTKRQTTRGELGKKFPFSAWTVAPEVRAKWNDIVKNEKVKGLFAGHFHSSKRESYQGFDWVKDRDYVADSLPKLYVCPPVASKKQENTPSQARGFREVSIDCESGQIKSDIFWYEKNRTPQLQIVEKDIVLSVDPTANTASGLIHLSNPTDKELLLSLSAEDFKSSNGEYGLNSKTLFALASASAAGQQVLEATVKASSTIAVKVDVSNFWDGGDATANLCNFGEPIGKLRASKWRPPFNVKIVAPVPDKPELTFTKNETRQVTLKNEDAMTYRVTVSAEVDGIQAPSSEVVLPPSSSVAVELKTNDDWFPVSASVKEVVRDGTIRIKWKPPNAGNQPLPERVIPLKAHLNYIGEFWQSFWGNGFVLVFVTLGGLCSLLLNNWVPNALNRADIQEQLGALANRTRDLSTHIDSRLRVLLRVERNRVAQLLKSHLIISAEFADVVKQSRDKIAMLNQQIDVASQLDRARLDLEHAMRTNGLAAIVDEADTELQKAADLLQRADPTKEEFDAAKALIVSASQRIVKMKELDADFEPKLRKKIDSLNQEFYPASQTVSEALSKLKTALGRVFTSFDKFRSATPLSSSDYWLVDLITEQLGLVRLYQAYYDSTKTPPFPKQDDYIRLLQTDTIASLRKAKLLLQQIKEGIFVEDILEAIKDPFTKVVIEPAPMEDRLAKFSVRFRRTELNTAAARDEIACEWNFGHNNLTETGWEAYHYFPRGGEPSYNVEATFLPPNAKPEDERLFISTTAKIEKEPRSVIGDRTLAEGLRLGIVLVIALIGLLAGAREQLTKLDLIPAAIAVFLLGFAADTIKNLISPKQAHQ